jgi:hypothetical protein
LGRRDLCRAASNRSLIVSTLVSIGSRRSPVKAIRSGFAPGRDDTIVCAQCRGLGYRMDKRVRDAVLIASRGRPG